MYVFSQVVHNTKLAVKDRKWAERPARLRDGAAGRGKGVGDGDRDSRSDKEKFETMLAILESAVSINTIKKRMHMALGVPAKRKAPESDVGASQ